MKPTRAPEISVSTPSSIPRPARRIGQTATFFPEMRGIGATSSGVSMSTCSVGRSFVASYVRSSVTSSTSLRKCTVGVSLSRRYDSLCWTSGCVTSITGMACATLTRVKTIGVLGGITWHSAAEYYRLLNAIVGERTNGEHAARCVLFSVDIGEIDPLMHARRFDEAGALIAEDAKRVEAAGADVFLLACNSLHTVWDTV